MILNTSGNSEYSSPSPIDWSKTKCTPCQHIWEWSSGTINSEPDFSDFCDCGMFEYWQLCFEPIKMDGSG